MLKSCALSVIFCLALLQAEQLSNEVHFNFQRYTDNNGVDVNQESGRFQQKLGANTAVSAHFVLDAITGASRRVYNPSRPENVFVPGDSGIPVDAITEATQRIVFPPFTDGLDSAHFREAPRGLSVDAISAASRHESRREFGGKLTHRYRNTRASLGITKSDEADYHSLSGLVNLTRTFANGSTVISFLYSVFKDRLRPTASSIAAGRGGDKLVDNFNISVTQDLTPKSTAMADFNCIFSQGYLGRPYYGVVLDDTADGRRGELSGLSVWESYPDNKASISGRIQLRRYFNTFSSGNSLNLEYRHYRDNWGVKANSVALTNFQYLHENLYFQTKYRFYTQTRADFYRHRYSLANINPESPVYLTNVTADPRLSRFVSHLIQAKLVFLLNRFQHSNTANVFFFFPTRLTLEIQRYFRGTSADETVRARQLTSYDSGGLRAWVFRTGLVFCH